MKHTVPKPCKEYQQTVDLMHMTKEFNKEIEMLLKDKDQWSPFNHLKSVVNAFEGDAGIDIATKLGIDVDIIALREWIADI